MIDKLISLIAPHICIGCGAEKDALLCESCRQTVATVPSRCYRCKATSEDYMVCKKCKTTTSLRQVVVYAHYTGLAKELVHRMKYERARSGIDEMAVLMQPLMVLFDSNAVLVHIPTASSRVRLRGYDHARLLALKLSKLSGLRAATFLARVGQAHQVGSGRTKRLRQLDGAFRAVSTQDIRGCHIVLVDDVSTSGATLETAARVLKRSGAKRVSAIVFAQA